MDCSRPGFMSIINSWSLLKLMPIKLVMPSNHLILCCPFLLLPSFFPRSGSFPMSHLFQSGGQIIRASASDFLMNIQDWFPLGLTGLISLQSKGLSRVFSSTTVHKHQFFGSQLSLWSHSRIYTWWLEKSCLWLNGLCWQVMPLLFNLLSRLVIAFLPRSKKFLMSWLQSPSTVILEPPPK